MLLYYIVATLLFALLTFVWSSRGIDLLIRLALFGMTVWGVIMIITTAIPNAQLATGVRLW